MRIFRLLLAASLFFAPNSVFAKTEDPYQLPVVVAVDNKKFNPVHDFTLLAGSMPLDSFYKAYDFAFSYTYGWKNYLRWEVINAGITTTTDTGLKRDLIENYGAQPVGILDSIKSVYTTNLVYTPIYSKNLFMNDTIIRGELSFVGGGGIVNFKSGDRGNLYGGGIILRYFWTPAVSLKLDTRLYAHNAANKSSNSALIINFGLSYSLGSEFSD
jgi:outer membrane beta-barrel protein